jgi:hypothetical protein
VHVRRYAEISEVFVTELQRYCFIKLLQNPETESKYNVCNKIIFLCHNINTDCVLSSIVTED